MYNIFNDNDYNLENSSIVYVFGFMGWLEGKVLLLTLHKSVMQSVFTVALNAYQILVII